MKLDIGCASRPRGDIGVDININSLKIIRHKFLVVCCDATYLPFRNNVFDVVFSYGSINYIRYDDKYLKEVHRVLKSPGYFVLSAYNHLALIINVIMLFKTNPPGALRLLFNSLRRIYKWYSPFSLHHKLNKKGFIVLYIYHNIKFSWRKTRWPIEFVLVLLKYSTA